MRYVLLTVPSDYSLVPLVEYRMRYKPDSYNTIIAKYSFIVIDSGLAVWLYVNPALTYAGDSLLRKVVFVSGCVGANFALTFWSADSTFEYLKDISKPAKVARLTDHVISTKYKIIGYTTLLVGGVLPSLLPSAAALQLGGGSQTERQIEAVGVMMGNLPQNTYGLLTFRKEHGDSVKKLFFCTQLCARPLTEVEIKIKNNARILKSAFIDTLRAIQQDITRSGTCHDFNAVPENKILELLAAIAPKKSNSLPQSDDIAPCSSVARASFSFVGASLGVMDFPGYIMSTKSMTDNYIDNNIGSWFATSGINILPVYMSGILGKKTFEAIYDAFYGLYTGKYQKSLSMHLYKKATAIATVTAATFAFFSYCTSVKLVKENFDESLHDVLGGFARASITMFNMYGSIGFGDFLVRMYARYFSPLEKRRVVHANESIDSLASDCEDMADMRFMLCMINTPSDLRAQLLRMPENEIDALLIKSEAPKEEEKKESKQVATPSGLNMQQQSHLMLFGSSPVVLPENYNAALIPKLPSPSRCRDCCVIL